MAVEPFQTPFLAWRCCASAIIRIPSPCGAKLHPDACVDSAGGMAIRTPANSRTTTRALRRLEGIADANMGRCSHTLLIPLSGKPPNERVRPWLAAHGGMRHDRPKREHDREKWESVFPRANAERVCAEIMLKQQ